MQAVQNLESIILAQDTASISDRLLQDVYMFYVHDYDPSDLELANAANFFISTMGELASQNRICGNPALIHSWAVAKIVLEEWKQIYEPEIDSELANPFIYILPSQGHDLLEDVRQYAAHLSNFVSTDVIDPNAYAAIILLTRQSAKIEFTDDPKGYLEKYKSGLNQIFDFLAVDINRFGLPHEVDMTKILTEENKYKIAYTAAVIKIADAIDNIETGFSMRNTLFVPLNQREFESWVENPGIVDLKINSYKKQIAKTGAVLEVFATQRDTLLSVIDDKFALRLYNAMLDRLYNSLIKQLDQEIARTTIELEYSTNQTNSARAIDGLIQMCEGSPRNKISISKLQHAKTVDLKHKGASSVLLAHIDAIRRYKAALQDSYAAA